MFFVDIRHGFARNYCVNDLKLANFECRTGIAAWKDYH